MANISVIVPVYNVEKYLDRCIKSIINQTFDDIEIILVNDGSTDRSGDICDEYKMKDSRIKVIHQNNKGVSNARNKGILEASGDYIQFVDPDDWIEGKLGEELYNLIKKDKSDIVFMGFKIYDEDGIFKREKKATKELIESINKDVKNDAINLFKQDLYGYTWCKLFKSSIIKENNILFDENISYCEDEEFTCRYYKFVKKISILDNSYYNYISYTKHRKTLSQTAVDNNMYIKDKLFSSWLGMLKESNKFDEHKVYLNKKAYNMLYYLLCNIIWSDLDINTRKRELCKLSKTEIYHYMKTIDNIFIKILLILIKKKSYIFFKVYNRLILMKKVII